VPDDDTDPVKHVGIISAKTSDGKCIGYISKDLNAFGQYTIGDKKEAATVCFDAPNVGTTSSLSFDDQTSTSLNATFVGAVIKRGTVLIPCRDKSGKWTVRVVETNYVGMTGTSSTGAGSGPTPGQNTITGTPSKRDNGSPGSGFDGESSIWNYDSSSQSVGVTWTNYDGSRIDTTPFFNTDTITKQTTVQLVSDTDSYLAIHADSVQISLTFESA